MRLVRIKYIIDLTVSGSDEDNQIYLKYYADEEYRQRWAVDWPGDPRPKGPPPHTTAIAAYQSPDL